MDRLLKPGTAKDIIKRELESRKLPFTKVTAKTVSFADLARDARLFVKIHGWQPNPAWNDLEAIARENGFSIE